MISLEEEQRIIAVDNAARLLAGRKMSRDMFEPELLVNLLVHHNLAPLASYRVVRGEVWSHLLEGEPLRRLEATVLPGRVRYNIVIKALKDLVEAIGHLEPVLFKGLSAASIYPEPYLRDPGDIDIVVDRGNFDEAVHCLEDDGWRPQKTVHFNLNPETAKKYGFARVFRHKSSPVIVDLHYDLVDKTEPFSLRSDFFLKNKQPFKLEKDTEIYIPGYAEHLAFLALHSVRHGHFRMQWCLDVHFACEQWTDKIDRDYFISICSENNIMRAVRIGIEVAGSLYGTKYHPLDHIPLKSSVERAVFRRSPTAIGRGHLVKPGSWRRFSAMVDLIDKKSTRVNYITHTLFPNRELVTDVKGEKKSIFYYLAGRLKAAMRGIRAKGA